MYSYATMGTPVRDAAGRIRNAVLLLHGTGGRGANFLRPELMRGDSVAFPPGGCAYTHVHQGPGIRCMIEGGIRIDTRGRSTSYGPGGAWYETGPDPVFAQAAADKPSRFIRVMILPRALIGKSSIQYVKAEDKDKPKTQSYKVYADAPIEFEGKS